MIEFFIPGNPVPKARPKVTIIGGHPHGYTPEPTRNWEAYVKSVAAQYAPDVLLDCPIAMELTFFLQKPKSKPKKVIYPATKPDIDNLIKSVKDALEGVIYTNDSRIVRLSATKMYSNDTKEKPGVYVQIEDVEWHGDTSSW